MPQKSGFETASKTENKDANDEIDDLITLNGCGYITQWRFPRNQQQCPKHLCRQEFKSRAAAISHYQEKHANDAILCEICDKPIATGKIKRLRHLSFLDHYKRLHPNTKIPYDFGDQAIETEASEDHEAEVITLN